MPNVEKSKTSPIPVRFDDDDITYLRQMATEGERTLSAEIRRGVKGHIQKHKRMKSLRGKSPQ